jgi:hypothetical protein
MSSFIWIAAFDGGYEGFRPYQAFTSEEDAKSCLALLNAGSEKFCLFKLPLWPNVQTKEWFFVDPERPSP